ncbi:hypothetical protein TrLO_g10219 [Triparma laevis f. longispina]|uniref:Uncharacterized protein n=3 Tax=Triparma laevis TaxID=1534972 RepID=A0A9W7F4Y6_9STRA|nr:hypothetical protein TrLO_g10219 [Triparma laevis f. longispina]
MNAILALSALLLVCQAYGFTITPTAFAPRSLKPINKSPASSSLRMVDFGAMDVSGMLVAASEVVAEASGDAAVASVGAGVLASRVALVAGFAGAAVKFGNFAKTLDTADDKMLTVMQADAPLSVEATLEKPKATREEVVAKVKEIVKEEEKKEEPKAVVVEEEKAPVAAMAPAPPPPAPAPTPQKEDLSAKVDAAAKKALAEKEAADKLAAEKALLVEQQRKDDLLAAKELAAKQALKKETEAAVEKLKLKEEEIKVVESKALGVVEGGEKKKGILKRKRVIVPLLASVVVGVLKVTGKVVFL